jgi:hypothetical protein
VDSVQAFPVGVDLSYRPSSAEPLLSVFRVIAMTDEGQVTPPAENSGWRPYLGAACGGVCLDIVIDLEGAAGNLRLPVPTGHLLDPASLEIEGGSGDLEAAPDGGPVLVLEGTLDGRIRYRTGPGIESQPVVLGSWPSLPAEADDLAVRLSRLGVDEAAGIAAEWVRSRVVYDTSEGTARRHRVVAGEGVGFADRCLAVGAGDCDVQNALLAAILDRSGVPVRMAVGFVGSRGRALQGLHAWVEVRVESGAWRGVDASRGGAGSSGTVQSRPPVDVPKPEIEPGAENRPKDETVPSARSSWAPVGAVSLAFGLASAVWAWFLRRRWATLEVRPGGSPDLAGLLRGALARPEAYRHVPALFSRGVVPVLGPATISLDRARGLARKGRLAVSSRSSDLARRVSRAGLPVIEGGRSEGDAVAVALGAVDLDRWDGLVRRSGDHPVVEGLERAAERVGEAWRLIVGSGIGGDVVILDPALLGLGRRKRVVAVDEESGVWRRVVLLAEDRPAAAMLVLADRIVADVRMPRWKVGRLLSRLAARALAEREDGGR